MDEEEKTEERLKKKKLAEQQKAAKAGKAEEQLKATLRAILEENAYDRIINVKLANSELFLVAAQNLIGIYKRVGRKINDLELLSILKKLKQGTENETRISFDRK